MPKQDGNYGNLGNMGQDVSMLAGSLFLPYKNNLWNKEASYWQKFLTGDSRFFLADKKNGAVASQPEKKNGGFWGVVAQLGERSGLQPGKREQGGGRQKGTAGTPIVTAVSYAPQPIVSAGAVSSRRHGGNGTVYSPITKIYQSYLTQQVQNHLHQTQLRQEEKHLHFSTLFTGGEERNSRGTYPSEGKELGGQETIPSQPVSPFLTGHSLLAGQRKEQRGDGEAISLLSPPIPDLSAPMRNDSMDWTMVASMAQNKMAEALTELLQNMIPETEGM